MTVDFEVSGVEVEDDDGTEIYIVTGLLAGRKARAEVTREVFDKAVSDLELRLARELAARAKDEATR